MKNSNYLKLLLIVLASLFLSCEEPSTLSEDPIVSVGHGAFLDHEGQQVKLTEPLIQQVQELYITRLTDAKLAVREKSEFDEQKIKTTRDLIYSTVTNDLLANALFIEWLIEQRKPAAEAHFSVVNNALRWHYVLTMQKDPILPDKQKRWSKGIPDDETKKLEENGIMVYAITNSSMQAYVQECLDAGVPVPTNMYGAEWKNLGEVENEFISQFSVPSGIELRAELLIHVSSNPEGFCMALPRYLLRGANNEAEAFGVICLGTRTSKACFFDNPRGTFFRRDELIDFRSNYLGGLDLVANAQGVCSDCHAGENPYVVHPAKAAFRRILDDNLDGDMTDGRVPSTMPLRWYDPIVPGTWPQNPGPTYVLDAVSSPQRCDGCHRPGSLSGGRFPDLSFPLPGYCTAVLTRAVRPIAAGGTMPTGIESLTREQQEMQRAMYAAHANRLTSFCSLEEPANGSLQLVTTTPNPTFISPPLIIDPIYGCATQVAVRGAVLNARVTLRLSRTGEPDQVFTIAPARSTLKVVFTGLPELRPRDVLTVTQEIAGEVSGSSSVTVRDFRDDYPMGPPKPVIDPTTVYACADLIAVRHVPGATLTVATNGTGERAFGTSTDWTSVPPSGAPFREMDAFTVKQSMCRTESDWSDPVRARAAPTTFPVPAFNPPNIYQGQELLNVEDIVHGAKVTLNERRSGWTGFFSTPVTWFPEYDIATAMGGPIRGDDNLEARQGLCAATSDWTPLARPHDCERLPAPQIDRPRAGDRFVVVSRSVPGARVMIYDQTRNEIGDGSGTVILLSRPLVAGEMLIAVQRVGQCTSRFGYFVAVSGG